MDEQTTNTVETQTTPITAPDEQTTNTVETQTTPITAPDEKTQTISTLDEQLSQKREQLTQAQITQTNAYSDYMKVMKAKTIVDEKDNEKVNKLDKLLFDNFITYQHALEEAQKLQVELSDLESQKYLDELLA